MRIKNRPGGIRDFLIMSKGTLKPFDLDLIHMVETVLKTKVNAFLEEGYIRLEVSALGASTNEIHALQHAVAGRLGERFIDFGVEETNIVIRFDSDPEQYPDQYRYELVKPVEVPGTRYARKLKEVDAIMFRRDDIEKVLAFTGGGTLTIPSSMQAPATYEFPTENGVLLLVKEGEYIVKDGEHFIKMSKRDFEQDFENK